MFKDHTTKELIKIVRTSGGSKAFIELLNRTIERVADVRIPLDKESDSIELRSGVVKVITEMLILPITKEIQEKKDFESTDYT